MCARRNDMASPSSTGARVLEVRPVDKVTRVIRAEPKRVHPPAAVSEALSKKKPSASKTNDADVSAMVKWTKIGCIGAPILNRRTASFALLTVPPRSVGRFDARSVASLNVCLRHFVLDKWENVA